MAALRSLVGPRVVEAKLASLGSLDVRLDLLVDGKDDSLAWRDTGDSRRDTLPEGTDTFLRKHIACNLDDSAERRFALHSRGALDTRLDRVNWSIREGPKRTRDKTNNCRLVRWQLGRAVVLLGKGLELLVCGEVGSCNGEMNVCRVSCLSSQALRDEW